MIGLWRDLTAIELREIVHERDRKIRSMAWMLVICTIIIGASAWGNIQRQRTIEAQDALIKADELRITNLVGRVAELEAEGAKKQSIETSRGGTRMPLIKWNLEEVKAMAKVVHAEARGESPFGRMMVARVIMNRVEANPGMTVEQVINRPNAFAQSEEFDSYDLNAVFEAAIETRFRDVYTFFNPQTATNQEFVASKMDDVVLTVGNHVFCR